MKYVNENGRSMVEMLGVLAIIGVLSVGGIAGYSKAMNKYKINKTTDQVSMLVANIRTIFSSQGNYAGLTNTTAKKFGVVPNDMYTSESDSKIKNAFNGDVKIAYDQARANDTGTGKANEAFTIRYDGLSAEACVTIATGDWGSGQASGLIAMGAGQTAKVTDAIMKTLQIDTATGVAKPTTEGDAVFAKPGNATSSTPIEVATAVNACSKATNAGSGYTVMWKYY